LIRIGNSLKDVGRLAEALTALEYAHSSFEKLYGADDMRTVNADEAVGWVLIDLGRLDEAEKKLDAAAKKVRASLGENTRRYANNLYDRALLYNARGELPRARNAFIEVARIHSETYAPNLVARGWALYQAAALDWRLGHHALALESMAEVERLWKGPMPSDSPIRAVLWGDMGELHFILGRSTEANAYIDKALVVLRAQSLGHELALAEVLSIKAEVVLSQGHKDKAKVFIADAIAIARSENPPSATALEDIATYERRQAELVR
jgi:tetratricopeptide (TPR) repeat protein